MERMETQATMTHQAPAPDNFLFTFLGDKIQLSTDLVITAALSILSQYSPPAKAHTVL